MTEIFSNSNFFHTLRHASAYLSPIFLIAFLVKNGSVRWQGELSFERNVKAVGECSIILVKCS